MEIVELKIISILDIDLKHLLYISIELFYEQIIIILLLPFSYNFKALKFKTKRAAGRLDRTI